MKKEKKDSYLTVLLEWRVEVQKTEVAFWTV